MTSCNEVFSLFAELFALSLKFFHFPRLQCANDIESRLVLKFLKVHLKTFRKSWRGQIFFKPVDQIGNVDRLSHNWIPLNAAARSSLGFRHQRGEKDDGRSLQLRISIDLSRYLASIFPWHHYVQQDQVRPEIVGTLMSFDSVVLFEYDVATFFSRRILSRCVLSLSSSTIRMRRSSFT